MFNDADPWPPALPKVPTVEAEDRREGEGSAREKSA